MSEEDWGWAPSPFRPEDAAQGLRRDLRDLGLTEREGRWERKGLALVRCTTTPTTIEVQRVKRPTRSSPEWLPRSLKSAADVRNFVMDLKKQLALWDADHD